MRAARPPYPAAPQSFAPWRWLKTLRRASPLTREITRILVLKFLLLWLLWLACFSHPVARHMRLDPARVQHQLLHTPVTPESAHAQR